MERDKKKVRKMPECRLCGKNGEDLTLLSADHKDLGRIMVCEGCWKKLWNENCTHARYDTSSMLILSHDNNSVLHTHFSWIGN
jgi:hypothetical protein